MKLLSVRDLKTKSSQVWKDLPDQKEIVVTNNGRPIAILSSVNENNLEQILSAFRQVRTIEAVTSVQYDSARKGTDKISSEEINNEIKTVRSKRKKMIIVLDTNVLVSGLLSPFGSSGEIVRMISAGKLILGYDSRILAEYQEVLNRSKFQFDKDKIGILIDYIIKNGRAVSASPLSISLPDPDEAPFLEVAIEGKTEYLVTGNKVHYPAKVRKGIKVLSPTEFIDIYRKIKDNAEPKP